MGFFRGRSSHRIAFLFGTLLNWFFRRRGKVAAANYALIAMIIVFIECAHISQGVSIRSSAPNSRVALQPRLQPGTKSHDGDTPTPPPSAFTPASKSTLNGRVNGLGTAPSFPTPRPSSSTTPIRPTLAGPTRIYLITRNEKKKTTLASVAPVYPITNPPTATCSPTAHSYTSSCSQLLRKQGEGGAAGCYRFKPGQ